MNRSGLLLCLVMSLAVGLIAAAQTPSGSWISDIKIVGLVPFEFSFRLENRGSAPLDGLRGRATITDRLGQRVDQIDIAPFDVTVGEQVTVGVKSRWDFQITGIYLLDVSLETGDGGLVSNSLAFRILPIELPLAPLVGAEGEGLYTVYQQPASWGLDHLRVRDAWTISHGSPDVVVAVIDSGIDFGVEQLSESRWTNDGEIPGNGRDDDGNGYIDDANGYDFRDMDASSAIGTSIHGHGTFVASIIAARPGELPIVGVAPGVRLMDVRFLDSTNSFRSSDWQAFAQAVDYAVDNGADIINMSIYANGRPPQSFADALDRAVRRGVIIVGIAGNNGTSEVMYPGRFGFVTAISATTADDLLASFSNYGAEVAFCAPGDRITSITAGGRAITQSGTSFSAPYVTGVLALILSVNPNLTAAEAIDILRSTAVDLGPRGIDTRFGAGLIDALAAVAAARP